MMRSVPWYRTENRGKTASRSLSKHLPLPSIDSQSSRLYWTEDGAGLGLRAPAEPGEYFYEIELQWEDPKITATYGLKLVMTGERSAYDEALDAAWDHFPEADALSFLGTQTVEGEACYRFEVSLSEGSKQVAVSKTDGTLFELPAA